MDPGSPTLNIASYPVFAELVPTVEQREGRYTLRFARTLEELDASLRLRFEVFNLELDEGLASSFETGRDTDAFDAVCHHLVVLDEHDTVVGTYRMQTSEMADTHDGFYSEGEFRLGDLPDDVRRNAVEVGRACVAADHRNTQVLYLLWRGLALYMSSNQKRYLFGCCSLTSQDPVEGRAMYDHLTKLGHMHPRIEVAPQPEHRCYDPGFEVDPETPATIPRLFRTYLRHGAKVCGHPAIDREFKTIDFLVLFDIEAMDERQVRTFFGGSTPEVSEENP
ncbi:MAG: GNAT family N-acyltransferase [Acidobacteriota bacterium]